MPITDNIACHLRRPSFVCVPRVFEVFFRAFCGGFGLFREARGVVCVVLWHSHVFEVFFRAFCGGFGLFREARGVVCVFMWHSHMFSRYFSAPFVVVLVFSVRPALSRFVILSPKFCRGFFRFGTTNRPTDHTHTTEPANQPTHIQHTTYIHAHHTPHTTHTSHIPHQPTTREFSMA